MINSDNGPQFSAKEFKDFCTQNDILHCTTAVYEPPSNAQAERCVRILKDALKQAKRTGQNPDRLLLSYLLIATSQLGKIDRRITVRWSGARILQKSGGHPPIWHPSWTHPAVIRQI